MPFGNEDAFEKYESIRYAMDIAPKASALSEENDREYSGSMDQDGL